jgi:hypothetical protein
MLANCVFIFLREATVSECYLICVDFEDNSSEYFMFGLVKDLE